MTDPGTTPPRAVCRDRWHTAPGKCPSCGLEGSPVAPAEPAEEREPEVFEFPISRHAYGRFVQESDYAKAIAERDEARFDLSVALPEGRRR
jgi:hypothetical protein